MNKIKFKILFILSFLVISPNIYAQACGGGVFTLYFYVLNGEKKDTLKYEILTIDPENLEKILWQDREDVSNAEYAGVMREMRSGLILDTKLVEDLFCSTTEKKTNEELISGAELDRLLQNSVMKKSALIVDGKISFHTFETYFKPYLLKITANEANIYILADFFGGCDRVNNVLLNKYPELTR